MESVEEEASDHESDDEPIGSRKRTERVANITLPPIENPFDAKRPKPDPELTAKITPIPLDEKLKKWTPQLEDHVSEAAQPSASNAGHLSRFTEEDCRIWRVSRFGKWTADRFR